MECDVHRWLVPAASLLVHATRKVSAEKKSLLCEINMLNIGQNRNSNIENLEIKVYKGFFGHNQISHDSDFVTIFKTVCYNLVKFSFSKTRRITNCNLRANCANS